jgi:hypothetical protein
VRGQIRRTGLGQLLHALRQADRVSLGRVVHAQVVADLAHDHLARVEAHSRREGKRVRATKLVGVGAQGLAQVEDRQASALGVILVRNGRAEKGHDPVARVLVDRAFEAMNAFRKDREEAIHDLVPFFGVDLFGEVHRALHVGEEHRHLLPLALEGRAGSEDLLR